MTTIAPPLPSQVAAARLVRGEPGALVQVAFSVLSRTALIATGIQLAGERERVWRYALAGALAVELAVLAREAAAHNEARAEPPELRRELAADLSRLP